MIYVPEVANYECYVVRDSNTIRAYKTKPYNGLTTQYRDYYINSNYLYQDGEQSFSNYSTLPVCLDSSKLTDNVHYRNDFDAILTIFLIMVIFCIFLPLKIFSKLFKKGGF